MNIPVMIGTNPAAPILLEHLDTPSRQHFDGLRRLFFDSAGVQYAVNPRLVRGLDYYELTGSDRVARCVGRARHGLLGWPL